MSVPVAELIVSLSGLYAAIGFLVAPILIFWASERFDGSISESTRGFRLLVLPGAILLWPILLRRTWAGAGRPPVERNAHRASAHPVDQTGTGVAGQAHQEASPAQAGKKAAN